MPVTVVPVTAAGGRGPGDRQARVLAPGARAAAASAAATLAGGAGSRPRRHESRSRVMDQVRVTQPGPSMPGRNRDRPGVAAALAGGQELRPQAAAGGQDPGPGSPRGWRAGPAVVTVTDRRLKPGYGPRRVRGQGSGRAPALAAPASHESVRHCDGHGSQLGESARVGRQ